MNSGPHMLIMGGGKEILSSEIVRILHRNFGDDVVILTPEDAKKEGLCSPNLELAIGEVFILSPKPEVFIIKAMPKYEYYPSIRVKSHEQKPWYARYDKNRRKKRWTVYK